VGIGCPVGSLLERAGGVGGGDQTDPARFDQRTPTAAFTLAGYTPRQVAERLARRWLRPTSARSKATAGWAGPPSPLTSSAQAIWSWRHGKRA